MNRFYFNIFLTKSNFFAVAKVNNQKSRLILVNMEVLHWRVSFCPITIINYDLGCIADLGDHLFSVSPGNGYKEADEPDYNHVLDHIHHHCSYCLYFIR